MKNLKFLTTAFLAVLFSLGLTSNLLAQCAGSFSPNQDCNLVTSSTGAFSCLTFCGIDNGAYIGSGSQSGSATWTIPGGTNSVQIDFNALSFTATLSEYLEIDVNGEFVDLNNATVTFQSGFPGCSSSAISSVTTVGATGYAGKSGVVITDSDNGAGRITITLDCVINTLTVKNVVVNGGPNGSVAQIRYCTDAPTGTACTGLGNPPSPCEAGSDAPQF